VVSRQSCAVAIARLAVPKRDEPSNKELKQTKPAQAMELRSLTPVFAALWENRPRGSRMG
jgi:hypothetical protein